MRGWLESWPRTSRHAEADTAKIAAILLFTVSFYRPALLSASLERHADHDRKRFFRAEHVEVFA